MLGKYYDTRMASAFFDMNGVKGLQTFEQDKTAPIIDWKFHRNLQTVSLASDTVLDATTIAFSPGHGFVVGNTICILEGQNASQFAVLAVNVNVITIDSPMDKVYTAAGTTVVRHSFDMRVAGSLASPAVFSMKPIPGQVWHISRVIFVIESSANSMDFTEFGSQPALTNGCVLRKKNGDRQNIFNWKSNGELINRSFDAIFQEKTGGGGSGFVCESSFGGKENRNTIIRLDGDNGDDLQVLVQDDLTDSSFLKIFMVAQGYQVLPRT